MNGLKCEIPSIEGYKNIILIGQGSQAKVYKAVHNLLGIEVAIKHIKMEI